MKIAICDDDQLTCAQLENILEHYKLSKELGYTIDVYYCAEDLIGYVKSNSAYDVIFLDIYMGEMDGICAGKILREDIKNINTEIIYVSSSDDHFKDALNIRSFNYIQKPIDKKQIKTVLDSLLQFYKNTENVFFYTKDRQHQSIKIQDILYFEINNRMVTMVTRNQNVDFYYSMKQLVENIKNSKFINPHHAFLVNHQYIQSFSYTDIIMQNGDTIPISQKRRKEIRQLLLNREIENEQKWSLEND